jgi:hypothetical protein
VINNRRVTGGDTPHSRVLSCTASTFCSAPIA